MNSKHELSLIIVVSLPQITHGGEIAKRHNLITELHKEDKIELFHITSTLFSRVRWVTTTADSAPITNSTKRTSHQLKVDSFVVESK
jgi:hypothetical protein